jgi:excisionase family DNA binding protein
MRHISHVNRANVRQITPQTVTPEGDWRSAIWQIYWTQRAARTALDPSAISARPGRPGTRSAGRLGMINHSLARTVRDCASLQRLWDWRTSVHVSRPFDARADCDDDQNRTINDEVILLGTTVLHRDTRATRHHILNPRCTMKQATPILRLLPPQRVAGSDQVAPIQYTIQDTARLLALSKRTVERLIERGELATVWRGKLKRVPYDSIVAYQNRYRNDEVA